MPILLIIGSIGAGKTTFLRQHVATRAAAGQSIGGIAAPDVFEHGRHIGYDLLDLRRNEQRPLARRTATVTPLPRREGPGEGPELFTPLPLREGAGGGSSVPSFLRSFAPSLLVGPYQFNPAALAAGHAAITAAVQDGLDVIAIDEIGPLEFAGQGWAPALTFALADLRPNQQLILVARTALCDDLPNRFPSPHWTNAPRIPVAGEPPPA